MLYVLLGIVVIAAAGYGIYRWRHKHNEEAQAAMGRAIAIARAEINPSPPANSKDPVFSTEQERAEQGHQPGVAQKYPHPASHHVFK